MSNKVKLNDIIFALLFMALSIFVYVEAMNLGTASAGTSDSGIFPKAVSCILFFLSILLIVRTIKKKKPQDKSYTSKSGSIPKGSILILLLTILYAFVSAFVGILIPIPFFVAGCLIILGYKKPLAVVIVSILSSVVVYVGFDLLLKIPLIEI